MLLHIPEPATRIVVEAEKSNKEKILRDIVKMLLFLDSAQADVAALICPTNYVHRTGVSACFRYRRAGTPVFYTCDKPAQGESPADRARRIYPADLHQRKLDILGQKQPDPRACLKTPNHMWTARLNRLRRDRLTGAFKPRMKPMAASSPCPNRRTEDDSFYDLLRV